MHIHFLNMLRPYSLCPLPHSHIKPHASCTKVPKQFYQTIGSPSGRRQITTVYAIILSHPIIMIHLNMPFYSKCISYIVAVIVIERRLLPLFSLSDKYNLSNNSHNTRGAFNNNTNLGYYDLEQSLTTHKQHYSHKPNFANKSLKTYILQTNPSKF